MSPEHDRCGRHGAQTLVIDADDHRLPYRRMLLDRMGNIIGMHLEAAAHDRMVCTPMNIEKAVLIEMRHSLLFKVFLEIKLKF